MATKSKAVKKAVPVRKLTMLIQCGETTCVDKEDTTVRCGHLGATKFGTVPVCLLFREPGNVDAFVLRDETGEIGGPGWLQRCPPCLEAERRSKIT